MKGLLVSTAWRINKLTIIQNIKWVRPFEVYQTDFLSRIIYSLHNMLHHLDNKLQYLHTIVYHPFCETIERQRGHVPLLFFLKKEMAFACIQTWNLVSFVQYSVAMIHRISFVFTVDTNTTISRLFVCVLIACPEFV